ncbi:hypothetical protein SESBI_47059 [Sesbania bispinosa]|nr:hypothetical protein SESBI_47059 [Sesbania bispinosa]
MAIIKDNPKWNFEWGGGSSKRTKISVSGAYTSYLQSEMPTNFDLDSLVHLLYSAHRNKKWRKGRRSEIQRTLSDIDDIRAIQESNGRKIDCGGRI